MGVGGALCSWQIGKTGGAWWSVREGGTWQMGRAASFYWGAFLKVPHFSAAAPIPTKVLQRLGVQGREGGSGCSLQPLVFPELFILHGCDDLGVLLESAEKQPISLASSQP